MAAVNPYLIPPDHLTLVRVTGMNRATDGTLSAGTIYTVTALVNALRHTVRREAAMIRPITRRQLNEVTTGRGESARLVCIKESDSGQDLSELEANYDYCYLEWDAAVEGFKGYFRIGDLDDNLEGYDQQLIGLDLGPCDVNGTQVTRTVSI